MMQHDLIRVPRYHSGVALMPIVRHSVRTYRSVAVETRRRDGPRCWLESWCCAVRKGSRGYQVSYSHFKRVRAFVSQKLTTPSEPKINIEAEVNLGICIEDTDSESLRKIAYRRCSASRAQDEKPYHSPNTQATDLSHLDSCLSGGI